MVSESAVTERPVSPKRSRAAAWVSAVSATAAAAVFAIAVLVPQETEASSAPAPMVFADASGLTAVLRDAEQLRVTVVGPAEPERAAAIASWNFTPEGASTAPDISVVTWSADLAARVTSFESIPSTTDASYAVGDLIDELTIAAGEFRSPFIEIPGDSRDAMIAVLEAYGMPQDSDGVEVVLAISEALDQWTLTNTQHSVMISLVQDAGEISSAGAATDRLGRAVTGLRVPAESGTSDTVLLISTETGRIVGMETREIADHAGSEGSLIGYRMWDVDAGALR